MKANRPSDGIGCQSAQDEERRPEPISNKQLVVVDWLSGRKVGTWSIPTHTDTHTHTHAGVPPPQSHDPQTTKKLWEIFFFFFKKKKMGKNFPSIYFCFLREKEKQRNQTGNARSCQKKIGMNAICGRNEELRIAYRLIITRSTVKSVTKVDRWGEFSFFLNNRRRWMRMFRGKRNERPTPSVDVPFNYYAFNCNMSEISTIGDDGWDSVDIFLKFFGC